jgi:GTPase SAR1 family protein
MTNKIKVNKEDYKKIIALPHEIDDIEDVERVFHEHTQSDMHPNNAWLMPEYPFKIIICGRSNSGKTVLMLNMLMKHLTYDTITLIGGTIQYQNKYSIFSDMSELFPTKFILKDSVGKIKMNKYDKTQTNVIVIDDSQEAINSEVEQFNSLFSKGRHHNINPVFICQDFFKAPIRARANTSLFILFKLTSVKSITRIWREVAADLEKDVFIRIFKEATQPESGERFSFLVVDTEADSIELKYRKGFNRLLLIDE